MTGELTSTLSSQDQTPRRDRLVRILVWCIVLLLVKVFVSIVWEYRRYFPADFESNFLSGRRYSFTGSYWYAFYIHIVSSPVALILAAFLTVSGGRPRWLRRHRWAGRLQFFLVLLVVVPSGMVMARDAYAGPISALGFVALNVATAGCLVLAVVRARSRKFVAHQRWATRTFILLASPLLLRIFAGVAIVTGIESERTYQLNSWISWLIPLLIYETCFSKSKRPQYSSRSVPAMNIEAGDSA